MKKLRYVLCLFFALLFSFYSVSASDIDSHWAKSKIEFLAEKGIMSGWNGNYMPDKTITRAEFVTLSVKALNIDIKTGKTDFSDVEENKYYAPYIKTAYDLGIISGYPDGTFKPLSPITREEAMIVLSRAFGFLAGYTVSREFVDFYEVSQSAKSAVGYAIKKGIISGYPDKTLRPKGKLTRAEAAVIIAGAMEENVAEPGFITGYPKVSDKAEYGKIKIDIATNIPCNIYYMIKENGMLGNPAYESVNLPLAKTEFPREQITATIDAAVGKDYTVWLVAKSPDGQYSNVTSVSGVSPLPFKEGDGSVLNPYKIKTQSELQAVKYYSDKAFILQNDIDLHGEWTPLGDFSGRFDGNGKAITNLYIDSDEGYQGLFSRVLKGEIKNLTVSGKVTAYNNAGLIAGEMLDARVINTTVSGNVRVVTNNAGGFFGENAGKIENCLSAVYVVEANAFAGGIAGQNYGVIKNSISAAHTVVANMYAGGISAINMGGRIEGSAALSVNVFDYLFNTSGRITTEKQNSVLLNNIAYGGMRTNQTLDENDRNNKNGESILWEDVVNPERLIELLGLDKNQWTGGGRDENYLILRPKGTKEPRLTPGLTEYAPTKVANSVDLYSISENPDKHYMLTRDLYFNSRSAWKMVADTLNSEEGFSGTLDGNGHTIYDLTIEPSETGRSAMFGIISTGTVRNLNIIRAKHKNGDALGVIAVENYGTIENCLVSELDVKTSSDTVNVGGICVYNYGIIQSSEAEGTFYSTSKNSTIGGICAHNEGYIDDVAFLGKIETEKENIVSESVAGGICGFMGAGSVYNSVASLDIKQTATTVYQGGIVGILSEGEIYKTASRGTIIAVSPKDLVSSSYSGGMAGLLSKGLVMHSFSDSDIKEYSGKSYGGGIVGFSEGGMIQQCYSTGTILQAQGTGTVISAKSYAGGILGYNEDGTVYSTVSLNESILSHGDTHRIIGGGTNDGAYENYTELEDKNHLENPSFSGKVLPKVKIDSKYFTLPVSNGGLIGWPKEIWQESSNIKYGLPVLRDVRYQALFG